MKTLFFDLPMGAAGDMLSAALYELLNEDDKKAFLEQINNMGLEGLFVTAEKSVKCGITGTHFKVTVNGMEEESLEQNDSSFDEHAHEHEHGHSHDHEHAEVHIHEEHHDHEHLSENEKTSHLEEAHHHHHHTSMKDIEKLVEGLKIPETVKKDVLEVYKLIAEAESHVHGLPVSEIHFHEVGTLDALADITAVCLLMNKIGAQKISASPINVGSGQVRCAHGILPVPAPATAYILKDLPVYSNNIKGELCTPTGAALLKHFVTSFGNMKPMLLSSIGYGMGKKDFEAANCLRALLGDTDENAEEILEFTCNLDDMSAEKLAFAMEELFAAGAIEVYTVPVVMKKSRSGNLLCVMCRASVKEKILSTIFKHTTTLGVRENRSNRYYLERQIESVKTCFGDVRIKRARGYGVERAKFEYEDLAAIARKTGLSIDEVIDKIKK